MTGDAKNMRDETRFEFRVFDSDLESLRPQLMRMSPQHSLQESTETYIVTRLNIEAGVKIRQHCLEMKLLEAREGILEVWQPVLRAELPVAAATFKDVVAPALGVDVDLPNDAQLTEAALIDVAQSVPALTHVSIAKRRSQFELDACMVELTDLDLGRATAQTVAFEGADFVSVMQAVRQLGLARRTNESYPCYLQRILF
jgi:hypothetical protein